MGCTCNAQILLVNYDCVHPSAKCVLHAWKHDERVSRQLLPAALAWSGGTERRSSNHVVADTTGSMVTGQILSQNNGRIVGTCGVFKRNALPAGSLRGMASILGLRDHVVVGSCQVRGTVVWVQHRHRNDIGECDGWQVLCAGNPCQWWGPLIRDRLRAALPR